MSKSFWPPSYGMNLSFKRHPFLRAFLQPLIQTNYLTLYLHLSPHYLNSSYSIYSYPFNSLGYKYKDKNQACLGHSGTHHDECHFKYTRDLINTCYLKELIVEWFYCMITELMDSKHLNTGTAITRETVVKATWILWRILFCSLVKVKQIKSNS